MCAGRDGYTGYAYVAILGALYLIATFVAIILML